MGIYAVKPKFQQLLKPCEKFLVRRKVHPTTINIAAFVVSLGLGCILYHAETYPLLLLAIPILALARTALNALDGLVARKLRVSSGKGEVLNEQLDRFSDVAIFFGLAYAPFTSYLLGSIAIIAVLLTSYLSILSKAAGASRQYGGMMGKADRMILLSVGAVLVFFTKDYGLFNTFFWILIIGMAVTFIQRLRTTMRELA